MEETAAIIAKDITLAVINRVLPEKVVTPIQAASETIALFENVLKEVNRVLGVEEPL